MRLLDDSELYRRSIIPRAFSHHVTDLQIMLWFSLLALIFLISLVWYAPGMRDWFVSMWNSVGFLGTWSTVSSASGNTVSGDPNAARITATAVLLGAWTGFAIRISTQVNERLGTVDLFLYQIVATCRVMVAVDMIRGFEILYDNTKLTGFANVARKEDYFSHFDSMGQAIGDLNRADVARTTEFFTYLKASRDATGSFSGWSIESGEDNPDYLPQARQEDVLHVVYTPLTR